MSEQVIHQDTDIGTIRHAKGAKCHICDASSMTHDPAKGTPTMLELLDSWSSVTGVVAFEWLAGEVRPIHADLVRLVQDWRLLRRGTNTSPINHNLLVCADELAAIIGMPKGGDK